MCECVSVCVCECVSVCDFPQTNISVSDDDQGPTPNQPTGSVATGNEMQGTRGNEVAGENDNKNGQQIFGIIFMNVKFIGQVMEGEGEKERGVTMLLLIWKHL